MDGNNIFINFVRVICIVCIAFIAMHVIGVNSAMAEGWKKIWEPDVSADDDTRKAIKDGFFWDDNVVLILSSSPSLKDPNSLNSLWYGPIPSEDPNAWEIELFDDARFADNDSINNRKIDPVFIDPNFIYFCFPDANFIIKMLNVSFEIDADIEGIPGDISDVYEGVIYNDSIYVGALIDGNVSVIKDDLPNPTFQEDEKVVFSGDPNRRINMLKEIDNHLFLSIEAMDANGIATLYRTSDGDDWVEITEGSYSNESSERIAAFVSLEKAGNVYWLFCRCRDTSSDDTSWRVFKSDYILSSNVVWEHALSINFNDPNIDINEIYPYSIGEYLYCGVSSSLTSYIWKSYKDEGWEDISGTIFDPNDYIGLLFADPNDNDYIYSGISVQDEDNDYNAKLYKRFVPRIDIEQSYNNRFYNTNAGIEFSLNNLTANWDASYSWILDGSSSFVSFQKNGESARSDSPNVAASSIDLTIDPNVAFLAFGDEEGLYTARFKCTDIYNNEENQENVSKDVFLCYDTNSPAIPTVTAIGEGDRHLLISWSRATDSLERDDDPNSLLFGDPNFHKSIKEYHLQIQEEDEAWNDPNSTSLIVAAYYDGNMRQEGEYSYDKRNLQNETTYKIRVRVMDKARNKSGWSEEQTATPYKPMGLFDLAGEESKCFINILEDTKEDTEPRWIIGFRADNQSFQDDTMETVYNDDSYGGRIEISYKSNKWIENSLELGYYQMSGYGLHPGTFQKSIDKFYFHILPLSTTLRILPFGFDMDWFMVPFIGFGLDCWFFREDTGDSNSDSYLTGYHGVFALRFLMDKIEPREAELLKEDYGVKNTYLTLGIQWNQIDDFTDEGLDLSGENIFLEVEFFF